MSYISQITEDIFVGPRLDEDEKNKLFKLNIKSILNLTGYPINGEIWCQVSDGNTRELQLEKAVKTLKKLIDEKQTPVYVHCVVGRNRSPLVIATYLTLFGGFNTLEEALVFVKNRHKKTSPFSNNIDTARRYIYSLPDR